jgi:hypothetical protein
LANVEPTAQSFQPPAYQPASTGNCPTGYSNNGYYSSSTLPQQFLAQQQQQAVGYQNGSQSYNHAALTAAAQAYAKATTAAHYSTATIPHGHYSTVSSKEESKKKPAELPDSYVIETETAVQPLDDWDKDHGKRQKRVHQVIENERGNP